MWVIVSLAAFPLVTPWGRALLNSSLITWLGLWFMLFYLGPMASLNPDDSGSGGAGILLILLIIIFSASVVLRMLVRLVAQLWRHIRRSSRSRLSAGS